MTKILMIMAAVLVSAVYAQTSQPVNINDEISTNSTMMGTPPRTVEDTTPVAPGENVPTPSNVRFFGVGGKPKPKATVPAVVKVGIKPEAKVNPGVIKIVTERHNIEKGSHEQGIVNTQKAWLHAISKLEKRLAEIDSIKFDTRRSIDSAKLEGRAAARKDNREAVIRCKYRCINATEKYKKLCKEASVLHKQLDVIKRQIPCETYFVEMGECRSYLHPCSFGWLVDRKYKVVEIIDSGYCLVEIQWWQEIQKPEFSNKFVTKEGYAPSTVALKIDTKELTKGQIVKAEGPFQFAGRIVLEKNGETKEYGIMEKYSGYLVPDYGKAKAKR